MTGREHRDLQWTIIASIAGPVALDFLHAIQAMVNFIYKAQAPSFTDSSITSLVNLLTEFHCYKQAVIDAGVCRGVSGPINHFEIPKLELLHNFACSICNSGASIQFMANVSEQLLITHCKNPFECTSHQQNTFAQQIVCLLDQKERMQQFHLMTLLIEYNASLNNIIDDKFDEIMDIDPMLTWIFHISAQDHASFSLHDCPIQNHFLKDIVSVDAHIAAHITVKPTNLNKSLQWISSVYQLPEFSSALRNYLSSLSFQSPPKCVKCLEHISTSIIVKRPRLRSSNWTKMTQCYFITPMCQVSPGFLWLQPTL